MSPVQVTASGQVVPDGYGGADLSWTGPEGDSSPDDNGGFQLTATDSRASVAAAAAAGTVVAVNRGGRPAALTVAAGGSFDLSTLYIASVSDLQVRDGRRNAFWAWLFSLVQQQDMAATLLTPKC